MKLTEQNLVRHWLSAVLLGEDPGFSLNGDKTQLKAVSEALMATRLFERELTCPEATVESVMAALDRKHSRVQAFERVFGRKSWPL